MNKSKAAANSQGVLEIHNLCVSSQGQPILRGLDLRIEPGKAYALMGPNGSGKSTLAHVIMGHPAYEITKGTIIFDGRNLLDLPPDERARSGIFLGFQYPVTIPGVNVARFLKRARDARSNGQSVSSSEFLEELRENMRFLEMDPAFANRSLNEGFSGGEKKRMEILQMLTLKPRIAILDETDSGLDIDALRIVAHGVSRLRGPQLGLLLITHYERVLNYIPPDVVHVMLNGRIVTSGGTELVGHLEEQGYEWVRREFGSR